MTAFSSRHIVPAGLLLAACGAPEPPRFSVVSFNSGTSEGMAHDADVEDGYTSIQAEISAEHYGNGLAWSPAIEAAGRYFETHAPTLVGFQEIFWVEECAEIPPEYQEGWVCEGWRAGASTVAQRVLGPDYQVACHPGKTDKCVAVRRDFGSFAGCESTVCLEAMEGEEVEGCGSGARVAWVDVERVGGTSLRIVHIHGSSGLTEDDAACRTAQFEAAFAAVTLPTVLLGDLNTDPGRWTDSDASASAFAALATDAGLRFLSDVGESAEPSYAGVVNIDHVLSDVFVGDCVVDGVTAGTEPVFEATYFDHHPVRCELQ